MGIASLIPPLVGINPAESVVEVTKPPQNDYKMTSEELDTPAVACGHRCAPQQNTSISAVLVRSIAIFCSLKQSHTTEGHGSMQWHC